MDEPIPDRSFVDQLKRMDKALGVRFSAQGKHFVITYRVRDNLTVNIWKVVDERGGFRQPDRRDLDMLQQSNIEHEGPAEKQARAERYMEAERERDRIRAKENIRDMTKDNKIQLVNGFSRLGGGKHNSAFRRIDYAPHGN